MCILNISLYLFSNKGYLSDFSERYYKEAFFIWSFLENNK